MEIKNRIELAEYFNKLDFKNGAEIGTCYGYYSEVLCQKISNLNLITVDNWDNPGNRARERKMKISCEESARKRLAPYPNVTVIKKNSIDAAKEVTDNSLDFVFIDADHTYNAVKEDLKAWVPKVRVGGIVAGHDYYIFRSGNRGVVQAVDEFIKNSDYKLKIIPWDNQAENQDNRPPCWYFMK